MPPAAVARLSERLVIPVAELDANAQREQTRTDHLWEIAAYLGRRSMDELLWKEVDESLFSRAMEHGSPKLLFRLGCEYLMSSRVIRPGVVWLLEHVATARAAANAATWQRLAHLATPQRRVEMDGLLVVDPSLGFTRLHWLSRGPEPASPAAVKTELEKLTFLRRLDAHELDLSMLPVERRRALATAGRRATGQSLQRKEEQRRYPILLTVLAQSAVDVLDDLLLLFDQAISGRESHAKAKLREKLAERAKFRPRGGLQHLHPRVRPALDVRHEGRHHPGAGSALRATLANFALFDLLDKKLSPRLRDLGKITLCRTGPKADFEDRYPHTGPLLTRRFNAELVERHWDDLLRLAASVKFGHASAALVVGKLYSSKRQQNALAAAHKEWGLLKRTIYAAQYLVDESYQRRIARQLNKGENVHALKRHVFYAHEGAVRRRRHEQQTEQANATCSPRPAAPMCSSTRLPASSPPARSWTPPCGTCARTTCW